MGVVQVVEVEAPVLPLLVVVVEEEEEEAEEELQAGTTALTSALLHDQYRAVQPSMCTR